MKKTYHAWYTRTEFGEKREVRATWQPPTWFLMAKVIGTEEEWTQLQPPPLEDVEQLHAHISAKYARRRATHDEMVGADAALREAHERIREMVEEPFTEEELAVILARTVGYFSQAWEARYAPPAEAEDAHMVHFENNEVIGSVAVLKTGELVATASSVQTGQEILQSAYTVASPAELQLKITEIADSLLD